MTTPRLLSCAVVTMLTLSACTSGVPDEPVVGPASASGVVGETGETAGPSGTPAPAELTTEDYRAELDKARGPIRDALKKLNATGGKGLDKRLEQTVSAMEDAVAGLEALAPPSEVKIEHGNYVGTLRQFLSALSAAQEDVRAQDVCTGPAVLTGVEEIGQLSPVRKSAAALAERGDYRTDVIPVKVTEERSRRLSNGKYIRSEGRPGRAYLELKNGNKQDAVVVLVRGKKKAIRVYVRKKSKFRIQGVRDGSYKVYYTLGSDWDSRAGSFTRSCTFEQFGKSVRFKTVYTATQIRWTDWTITLNAVAGGTVPPKRIKPGDFPG
ncbi:hypothetical protein FHR32_008072 [Streptosporangium album]|uniref:Uncharacterized protein n=1 Tax=Streptosporangium album TaxID=47479 RepID=A0A7W7S4C3_9ACTN|nr:hypothetical protein [Streptosporangium album]MBB4943671.1 hypothetical protein [Streptosporangium album]